MKRRIVRAKKKNPKAAPPAEATMEENTAQAAFAEYEKRMRDFHSQGTSASGGHVGQMPPPMYWTTARGSYPPGMPMAPMPPPRWTAYPPAMMQQPPVSQQPPQEQDDPPVDSGNSLFESVGNMIRLGVNVVNAGLVGGMQIIESFSGQGRYECDPYWDDNPSPHPYHRNCYHEHHSYGDCCYEQDYLPCGCNPSVHNCNGY